MTFGQKVTQAVHQMVLDNLFIIILMIVFSLLVVDYYNRFLKIVKKTDHVDLVERYLWLQMYRRYQKGRNYDV
jgi:hypothetical protein